MHTGCTSLKCTYAKMYYDADHPNPTRTVTLTRTQWGDLCLDAAACESLSLIRPKWDPVNGGCAYQNSHTRVFVEFFRIRVL